MREGLWEFDPTHTVIVAANHKPEVRKTDKGIWRRIKIVPWEVSIPNAERDPKLPEKLEEELEGILAWVVKGALEWQLKGLAPPAKVEAETDEYREEQDVRAGFLADKCFIGEERTVRSDPLYVAYKDWCDLNGQTREAQNKFAVRLRERGFSKRRMKRGIVWDGLALRDDSDPTPGVPPDQDPTPPESRIDKPDSGDVQRKGVGYEPNFRLTAEVPYANTAVNRENPTPPYTPTP